MERTVDLNCDLGESVDGRAVSQDAPLYAIISSANIACGFHAGDTLTMRESCRLAVEYGVTIGAHVSYRDREGFGRRDLDVEPGQLYREVLEQILTLAAIASGEDGEVCYVKPHGALYNRIVVDSVQADAVARATKEASDQRGEPYLLVGLAGSAIEAAAARHGVGFIREAFIDRAYNADGTLVSRSARGAVLTDADAIAARAVRMVTTGEVESIDGTRIRVQIDSMCVHGDTPDAAAIAALTRQAFETAGVRVAPFARPDGRTSSSRGTGTDDRSGRSARGGVADGGLGGGG